MEQHIGRTWVRAALVLLSLPVTASAQEYAGDVGIEEDDVRLGEPEYSPYLNRGYPQRVFWGDAHVHTSYSTDAGMLGNYLGPDEAYRFAMGEEVTSSTGVRARLQRPLDWLVVADHAENLGLAPMIAESNPELLRTAFGREIHDMVKRGDYGEAFMLWGTGMSDGDDPLAGSTALTRSIWERLTAAAEEYYRPGVFTALIGFEWTSSPGGNNLHRNVIFRDGKAKADRVIPYSQYDSDDPEDLWAYMAAYEENTGGRVLAIPHNGNLSNGLMFDVETLHTGTSLDRNYAERRARWEPLYEVTQIKRDGEAHPFLSPDDEFADYGTWDKGSFGAEPKTEDMLEHEYARSGLKLGLSMEESLGANPFKFGMIGSTDSHTSLATIEEDNFFGKATPAEPGAPGRFDEMITGLLAEPGGPDIIQRGRNSLASGLAAVWATENTREALFDAMQRKEVYATTGTRITLRVFAGWDFTVDDVVRPDFADTGYLGGVPMGGDLTEAPAGSSPKFMVRALRDPDGANLDRIQIVKGWLGGSGELLERVYDVAVSDGREIGSDGRARRPVGNTVEVANATYTNSIGDALLMGYWEDPDFDPTERAFYYVRVIEIPTPRWTTYDAAFFGVDLPEDEPASHQERAYTSPIWYTP